jgi:WD40 repeat protein
MKIFIRLLPAILFIAATMISIPGCEYDIAQSLWWDPSTSTNIPVITSIQPDQATAGVNLITIIGENFGVTDANKVYFQNLAVDPIVVSEVEPIAVSATSITVRRPNLASDSCIVMVSRQKNAEVVAKSQPYKIDQVIENYGSFVEKDKFLSAVAVDADENIYVSSVDSMFLYKVVPGQGKIALTKAAQVPVDMTFGPDGRLYMVGGGSGTGGNRYIYVCNVQTGEVHQWVNLGSGKNVKFGDFDDNGYFYAGGGNRVDLWIITPDSAFSASGLYATNEILGLKYYANYLYVVAKTGTGASAVTEIYKHSVGANGTLGTAELVLNFTATPFGSRTFRGLTFSNDGTMFIATDDEDPLLVLDSDTNQLDYFYKDIIPNHVRDMNWGTGNYLYITSGQTTAPAQDWTVDRIDMGAPGSR